MSEKDKEQHPLLCDEDSEEEINSPEYQRRYRPLVYKGRARVAAKGATIVLTRWPEHWTSLVGFWWLAIGMFIVSTFIVYRFIIAFAIVPPTHGRPSYSYFDSHIKENSTSDKLSNVYMHVFVNDKDEVNLPDYISHVEKIARKYSEFNFKLIIVLKDVKTDSYLSAEEQNTIALNSLWENEKVKRSTIAVKDNIQVEHTTLSKCMDSSPLRKYWMRLPPQIVEFLVRAVSVWDRGGIAINPDILTPRTPSVKYLDKFNKILSLYGKHNATKLNLPIIDNKISQKKQDKKVMRKVNNIRDIIEILENDNSLSTQDTLVGAENTPNTIVAPIKRKLLSTSLQDFENQIDIEATSYTNFQPKFTTKPNESEYPKTNNEQNNSINSKGDINSLPMSKSQKQTPQMKKSPSLRMLPLFLEFIFKDKVQFDEPKVRTTRQRKSVIPLNIEPKSETNENRSIEIIIENPKTDNEIIEPKYKPMIISAQGTILPDVHVSSTEDNVNVDNYDKYTLTIDLRGNILATKTPCHAFLGTMFSNIMQHTQNETLKDFIISELSLFCKGLLSSCRGIDLVLL